MTKKQHNIMIGLIIWAGLLIIVLYSPIGSPDLYDSQNYYTENSAFATQRAIPNAPKRYYTSENSSVELDIPDISSHLKTNYHVRSYPSSSTTYKGSSYSVQTQSYQSSRSSGYNAFGSSSSPITTGRRSANNNAGNSGITMTNGITTLSTSTGLIDTPAKQSVATPYTPNSGGTDPGGDPTGDPIPVGDGWELLVFFGVCYTSFKKREYLKRQLFFYISKKI